MDQLVPDGPIIYVIGPNEAGKTTALDALLYALAGKGSIPEDVIRHGADKAEIRLTLDDGRVVERVIRQSSAEVKFLDAEGEPGSSPQAALTRLVGPISLDPWAFSTMKDSERQTAILRAKGMEGQLAELDGQMTAAYGKRHDAGRDLKTAQAQLSTLDPPPVTLPDEPVDTEEMEAELEAMVERGRERKNLQERIEDDKREVDRMQRRLAETKSKLAEIGGDESLNERILTGKLARAEATNTAISEATVYRLRAEERRAAEDAREGYNTEYLALEKRRAELLAGIDLGVPGFKLEHDGSSTVDGVAFDNLATSKKLKVGCGFAMQGEPDLKIVRITDGSLLDQASLAFLETLATEKGYRVWIEMVYETGESGLLLVEELPKKEEDQEFEDELDRPTEAGDQA